MTATTTRTPDASAEPRSSRLRTRWAAIGAAVAVTLGAGGLTMVSASGSPASRFVAITPERILDTRAGEASASTARSPPRRPTASR